MQTQTAGLLDTVTMDNVEGIKNNVLLLLDTMETKYVEKLDYNKTIGMAIKETNGWGVYSIRDNDNTNPVCIRTGLYGFIFGHHYWQVAGCTNGAASTANTFRPVIWNIE